MTRIRKSSFPAIFFTIIGLTSALITIVLFINSFLVFPNTFIGKVPIGLFTKSQAAKILSDPSNRSVMLTIKGEHSSLPYALMGITVDEEATFKDIFQRNRAPLFSNIRMLVSSFFIPQRILPTIRTTAAFSSFLSSFLDQPENQASYALDQDQKIVRQTANHTAFALDATDVLEKVRAGFGDPNTPIEPIVLPTKTEEERAIDSFNARVSAMTGNPLYLYVREPLSASPDITLTPETLATFITVSFASPDQLTWVIDGNAIQTYLTQEYVKTGILPSVSATPGEVAMDVSALLAARYNGSKEARIIGKSKDVPNTNGEKAAAYIEIDLSAQKLYLFQKGSLVKSYRISSGRDFPTPVGQFKILNKSLSAFSWRYNVYMPYWMAFYYHPIIKSYFGIHELPYFFKSGEIVRRPRINIGTPATGGCVALDIGQAREVYEFAEIGTPVYIFE